MPPAGTVVRLGKDGSDRPATPRRAKVLSPEAYADAAQARITSQEDQSTRLLEGITNLSEGQNDKLEVLLHVFDQSTLAAYEKLDDLAAASLQDRPAKKLELERSLDEQQQAGRQVRDWLISIGQASQEPH